MNLDISKIDESGTDPEEIPHTDALKKAHILENYQFFQKFIHAFEDGKINLLGEDSSAEKTQEVFSNSYSNLQGFIDDMQRNKNIKNILLLNLELRAFEAADVFMEEFRKCDPETASAIENSEHSKKVLKTVTRIQIDIFGLPLHAEFLDILSQAIEESEAD